MTSWTDFAVPLLTFRLDVLATLLMERRKRQRDSMKYHIQQICDPANEWYNQLHELATTLGTTMKEIEVEHKVTGYLNNRIILPRYIRTLEVLRRHRSCGHLAELASTFLQRLTNYDANRPYLVVSCELPLAPADAPTVNSDDEATRLELRYLRQELIVIDALL